MGVPWRKILDVAITASPGFIPPGPWTPIVATIALPALRAALERHPRDLMEEWGKDIEALSIDGSIETDKHRAMIMKGKIRWDTYQRSGKIPPKEEVRWLLETLVMTYYGVSGIDELL